MQANVIENEETALSLLLYDALRCAVHVLPSPSCTALPFHIQQFNISLSRFILLRLALSVPCLVISLLWTLKSLSAISSRCLPRWLNVGFNCAESTNFATPAWIEHGAAAHFCRCSPDQQSVRLDMGLFLAQAPDKHAQALVKQWVSEDQAAGRKSAEKLLNQANKKHAALDSQHGCSNKQQQADGSKLVCKTRTHATIQGMEAIQATSKGKAAVRLVTQKKAGAVRKPARCTKVIKKAFKHSKAELGSAGKADSKKVAAMLKMAKRAEVAPSAAAKMPQLQPIVSSAKSSLRPPHAVKSPAQA